MLRISDVDAICGSHQLIILCHLKVRETEAILFEKIRVDNRGLTYNAELILFICTYLLPDKCGQ